MLPLFTIFCVFFIAASPKKQVVYLIFRIDVCNMVLNYFASQSFGNYTQKYEPITNIVANLHATRENINFCVVLSSKQRLRFFSSECKLSKIYKYLSTNPNFTTEFFVYAFL